MSGPILRTSGRTLPSGKKKVRVLGYHELIPNSDHLPPTPISLNYAQFQKAESVYSDKAAVASAREYTPTNMHHSLGTKFPSIRAAKKTLSLTFKLKKLREYRAAADIFLSCVTTIVDQMQHLPNVDHNDPEFLSSMSSLVSIGAYFVASITNLKSVKDHQAEDKLNESHKFARLLYAGVSDLLGIAIRTTFKTKPLPDLPPGLTLQVVEDSQSPLETPSSSNSPLSSLEEADELTSWIDIHVSKDKNSSPLKHKITWRLPRRSPNLGTSKSSFFSFKSFKSLASRSSVTLVQPDVINPVKLSFRADIEPAYPSIPAGGIRHSVLFFPNDPLNPDSDVKLPMPTGESAALSFDAEGRIKGGSLPALVAVLTSRQGVTDHELTATIYTYFRSFTTPTFLFHELAKRYEEPQPGDLTDDQARVWEKNASIVRIRVAKAMLDWLNQYWRPETDNEILEDMQIFAEERVEIPGHPKAIFLRVIEKINNMNQLLPEDALTKRVHELVARVELKMPQEPITPTGFIFPERFTRDVVAQLQQFNSPAGREEFARQLAMKLSSMFRDVDPVDAVAFWRSSQKKHDKHDKNAAINPAASKAIKKITMFEQSLSIWVSYSIIKPNETLDRVHMVSFWLDIATVCHLQVLSIIIR